jgi:hypothetical protein
LTGRVGDAVRVPSVGLYCTVDVEAFRPRFLCSRLAGTRGYDVSFERNRTVVGRVGDPGEVTTFREDP